MWVTTTLRVVRQLSQFHENQTLLAWIGKVPVISWLTPIRRRFLLLVATLVFGVRFLDHTLRFGELWSNSEGLDLWVVTSLLGTFLGVLTFLGGIFLATKHLERLPAFIKHYPQTSLHVTFWMVIVLVWVIPSNSQEGRSIFFIMGLLVPFLIWRCGYMVMLHRRNKIAGTRFRDHLLYLLPAWNATNLPYGKGWEYLGQVEAKTDKAYVKSFLAGIKLLMLSATWYVVFQVMNGAIYGDDDSLFLRVLPGYTVNLPRLAHLVSQEALVSLPVAWLSLYLELISVTLELAIYGHLWIGILRLAGFHVFRNTYKPLLAQTILDFWNRFHYYFKELLVELFFFPTYLRYSWMGPKLRTFTAVFMAVFVGNMYYHVFVDMEALLNMNLSAIWQFWGPRMVYCLLLVAGIYCSMLNQQRQSESWLPKDAGSMISGFDQLRRLAFVWTFYGLIHIWNLSSKDAEFVDRADFSLFLFGL